MDTNNINRTATQHPGRHQGCFLVESILSNKHSSRMNFMWTINSQVFGSFFVGALHAFRAIHTKRKWKRKREFSLIFFCSMILFAFAFACDSFALPNRKSLKMGCESILRLTVADHIHSIKKNGNRPYNCNPNSSTSRTKP